MSAPAPPPSSSEGSGPSVFLKQILGQPVRVRLNSGVDYRGTCAHGSQRKETESLPSLSLSLSFFVVPLSSAWFDVCITAVLPCSYCLESRHVEEFGF